MCVVGTAIIQSRNKNILGPQLLVKAFCNHRNKDKVNGLACLDKGGETRTKKEEIETLLGTPASTQG